MGIFDYVSSVVFGFIIGLGFGVWRYTRKWESERWVWFMKGYKRGQEDTIAEQGGEW